jgi:hypothetical protein
VLYVCVWFERVHNVYCFYVCCGACVRVSVSVCVWWGRVWEQVLVFVSVCGGGLCGSKC